MSSSGAGCSKMCNVFVTVTFVVRDGFFMLVAGKRKVCALCCAVRDCLLGVVRRRMLQWFLSRKTSVPVHFSNKKHSRFCQVLDTTAVFDTSEAFVQCQHINTRGMPGDGEKNAFDTMYRNFWCRMGHEIYGVLEECMCIGLAGRCVMDFASTFKRFVRSCVMRFPVFLLGMDFAFQNGFCVPLDAELLDKRGR